MSFSHRSILSSGHHINCVEVEGADTDARPVVFVHGFPESWYSWRHQLPVVADAGFRPIAIDVRGYGHSDVPVEIEAYAMTALVGDVVAVIDEAIESSAADAGSAIVVGHDWGAPIAWNTALLRPDLVGAVAGLSVPYNPRGDSKPLDTFRAFSGENLFYIDYFQEPGVVEAEVEVDLSSWLRGFYFTASAEADPSQPSMGFVPPGQQLRDRLQQPNEGQMAWLPEQDFQFYVSEFERTGLTGGFNRYRNITRDWYELAPWRFAPIVVPSLFVGGDKDGPTILGQGAIDRFDVNLPNLVRSEILTDCGHWVQQEKPNEVNEILLEFLTGVG